MAPSISKCSTLEWFENFKKIDPAISGEDPFYPANTFFAQQYFGLEIFKKATREAYALNFEEHNRAWLLCCPLSDEVIRLRGIYCEESFRRRGFAKLLVNEVCQLKKKTYRTAVLFVPQSKLNFYEACGFSSCNSFTPRKLEYFNPQSQTYELEMGETFSIMIKDL